MRLTWVKGNFPRVVPTRTSPRSSRTKACDWSGGEGEAFLQERPSHTKGGESRVDETNYLYGRDRSQTAEVLDEDELVKGGRS